MNKIFIIVFLLLSNLFLFISSGITEENKVKIGLLVPLTGDNAEIGKSLSGKRKIVSWMLRSWAQEFDMYL